MGEPPSAEEVQRRHDVLAAVLLGEVRVEFRDNWTRYAMQAALDTMCWVLGHDHNTALSDAMTKLEREIAAAGYVLEDHGAPGL